MKEQSPFHHRLIHDLRLTTKNSAFSHGDGDKKREHQNQIKRCGFCICLSHVYPVFSFNYLSIDICLSTTPPFYTKRYMDESKKESGSCFHQGLNIEVLWTVDSRKIAGIKGF